MEESARGTPIIVEGKKDITALRALGVDGTVIAVKTGGKSFQDSISEIEKMGVNEVVLFLGFDRRGKEVTRRLKQSLEPARIKPNTHFLRALSALVAKDIQCIQSLTSYLDTIRKKVAALK